MASIVCRASCIGHHLLMTQVPYADGKAQQRPDSVQGSEGDNGASPASEEDSEAAKRGPAAAQMAESRLSLDLGDDEDRGGGGSEVRSK